MHLGFDKQTKTLQLADGEGRISSVVFTSGVDLNANSSSVATITTIGAMEGISTIITTNSLSR